MADRTSKRIILGSAANGVGLLARVAEQLLMVPILLASWSASLYGEWLLVAAVPIYLSLSDFGFVTASSNELARRSANGISAAAKSFYSDFLSAFARWSLLLSVLLGCGAFLVPLSSWLGLSHMTQFEAGSIFALLTWNVLLNQNGLVFQAGLRACRNVHSAFLVRAVAAFIRIGAIALAVSLVEAGPLEVAALTVAVRMLEVSALALLSHLNGLTPRVRLLRRPAEKMAKYLGLGAEFTLIPLAEAIVLQGMVIIVGVTMGAVLVAVFSTHRTLTRLTFQIVRLGVQPLIAEAGLLQGAENREQLRRLVSVVSRLTFWTSLAAAAFLMIAGPVIFSAWTHGQIGFLPFLFAPLLLATILEGIWRVPSAARLGTNQHRPLAWGFFLLSLFGTGAAFALSHQWGLIGAACALVLVHAGMCVLTLRCNQAVLGASMGQFIRDLTTPPILELRYVVRKLASRKSK
ncbi:lipopolysaccharide biosynthesis protein [Leisingera sp. McT4-56]|uniref:lipopolysaccharide biosynthesis protein n=1 Tax=Leisingera sp. McT4-56 TaxID=2881255 RepID=UPI001CF818F1|nr:hypothetical protein [Leisingera sp. McT4-56]MCB4457237.1 hypothetical protein [Leisingera sp. McT4-56]